jgi:hypothetical protein
LEGLQKEPVKILTSSEPWNKYRKVDLPQRLRARGVHRGSGFGFFGGNLRPPYWVFSFRFFGGSMTFLPTLLLGQLRSC